MKIFKPVLVLLAIVAVLRYYEHGGDLASLTPESFYGNDSDLTTLASESVVGRQQVEAAQQQDVFAQAFAQGRSNLQLQGTGRVARLLADDNDGSRHQRFILELPSGQTLLVAHNIDLAPRVEGLATGDEVELYGEYEWNAEGGVMHWTHHDPQGRHEGGWIRHAGRTYR